MRQGQPWDLRAGDWRETLADVEQVDAVICDPPYGDRTHRGNETIATVGRRSICYASWSPDDVRAFVASWAPRCRGWFACMTSDDLIHVWRSAYEAAGLYSFAPVVITSPRVRLVGDGPASCAVYLMVARPRKLQFSRWGALPGHYPAPVARGGHIGGKPLDLMRAIVCDYTRRGDLVVDPCAGYGTTLRAAIIEGREAVGSEIDAETYAKAAARLAKPYTPNLLLEPLSAEQRDLF
tara:strand:+ start:4999 stop:5709 length:711 start_codon:yes stop_codon:yes gene_type:complete